MTEKKKDKECECGDENCDCGAMAMSPEQIIQNNNIMVNVLMELLLEKKVISEEDLKKKFDELVKGIQ
jgi:hypothetical protein